MANIGRKIGTNIRVYMLEADLTPESFARQLGYSVRDMWNILEGKVVISPVELDKIADLLKTTKGELIRHKPKILPPDLQYTKEFSNPDHLDTVLDLLDEYVELMEAV